MSRDPCAIAERHVPGCLERVGLLRSGLPLAFISALPIVLLDWDGFDFLSSLSGLGFLSLAIAAIGAMMLSMAGVGSEQSRLDSRDVFERALVARLLASPDPARARLGLALSVDPSNPLLGFRSWAERGGEANLALLAWAAGEGTDAAGSRQFLEALALERLAGDDFFFGRPPFGAENAKRMEDLVHSLDDRRADEGVPADQRIAFELAVRALWDVRDEADTARFRAALDVLDSQDKETGSRPPPLPSPFPHSHEGWNRLAMALADGS